MSVAVICPAGTGSDSARHEVIEGIEVLRFPLQSAEGGPFSYISEYAMALFYSVRLTRRVGKVDTVQICNPPDLLWLVTLPLKLRGARVIFDHHDLVPELYLSRFGRRRDPVYWVLRLLERVTFQTADVVISTNESYRSVATGRGGKHPSDVFVVRSAPDSTRFQGRTPTAALKGEHDYLLAYLGSMGPQDGVEHAVDALAILRDECGRSDWKAYFVGGGDCVSELKTRSERHGLGDRVVFTGRIPDTEMIEVLSTADVCLSPDPANPLNEVSTMNKVVEYMSLGKPLVSFDLKETRVSAGEAAIYARPGNDREFAQLISKLLDDEDERRHRGEIGRERASGELSWERSTQELLAAYRRALTINGGRPGSTP